MTPLLLDGPAQEPVGLPALKEHLRIDGSDEDGLLAALVVASRLIVEAQSGRLLISQTWRIILDAWPPGGIIHLPFGPVQRIAAARVIDAAGAEVAVQAGALALDARSDPPRIRVVAALPHPGSPFNGVEIDIVAGFGDAPAAVPAPLVQAVTMLAARWFEYRGDMIDRDDPKLPPSVAALIAPYRRVRL